MRLRAHIAIAGCLLATGASAGTEVSPLLRAFVEERYDDDPLSVGHGGGQLMTKLSAQLGVSAEQRTLEGHAWYAPDLMLRHGSGSTALDHRAAVGMRARLSRTDDVRGWARLWRVSDPTSLPRLGLARTLSPILYGQAGVDVRGALSPRWIGRLGHAAEGARIDAHAEAPGLYHSPRAELTFLASRRLELGGEYRFQLFRRGDEGAYAHGGTAFVRYRLTRQTSAAVRAGPIAVESRSGSALLPRVLVEVSRDGPTVDFALAFGEDLVGASGFTAALWAHHASALVEVRPSARMRAFAAASYFRNAPVGRLGFDPLAPREDDAQGYVAGAGLEWRFNPDLAAIGTVERFAQLGGATDELARNIASLRLVATPWRWVE